MELGRRGRRAGAGAARAAKNPASPVQEGGALRLRGRQIDEPTVLRMLLIAPPRKISATIATIVMSARINAYSARPWPSSLSRRMRFDECVVERHDPNHLLSKEIPRSGVAPTLRAHVLGVNARRGAPAPTEGPVRRARRGRWRRHHGTLAPAAGHAGARTRA